METKRLPLNKSNLSLELAAMELEDAYHRDRIGALVKFTANLGLAPVWLQQLKDKMKRWWQAFTDFTSGDSASAWFLFTGRKPDREVNPRTGRRQDRQAGEGENLKKENFHRISFPTKKSLEEAFAQNLQPQHPYRVSLLEKTFFTRPEQPAIYCPEVEELAQTGFWEFQVPSSQFNCTGNALKLVQLPQPAGALSFQALTARFQEADQAYLAENWPLLLSQGRELDYNARITDLFGDKWIKIKAKAIWENATITKVIGFFQDITASQVQEQLLREARQTAEQEMKAKSDFVSVISHEIRTPLNAISGFTHLLLQEDVSREEQKDYLRSIQFSTRNLLSLINATLDYSKIEAGKVEFEHIHFQFHELLEDIHRSFYLRAAEKKVNLYLDIRPGTPDVAVGDPAKLCQILNNLISNAIKFTQEGHVKISVDVVYESETDWVFEFAVSDTGVGIAPEKQPLIFESFTQANAATNRQFGGTGLGLTITKKLVELQNGSIQVHSVPQEGSEFIVCLKLAKPDPAYLAVHRPDLPLNINQYVGLQGAKILVVDDNALNRNVASKLLTNWQVQVDTAENGLEALQKIRQHTYDIILMDLFMPVMDGFKAIAQIKQDGLKTPIIALTGSAPTEEENKMMDLGVHDYVTKPFNPQELYKTILEHLILIEV
jgi:signal transduction histidine kinase